VQALVEHDQLEAVQVEVLSDHFAVVEDVGSNHKGWGAEARFAVCHSGALTAVLQGQTLTPFASLQRRLAGSRAGVLQPAAKLKENQYESR
jgi:hypothetical protein